MVLGRLDHSSNQERVLYPAHRPLLWGGVNEGAAPPFRAGVSNCHFPPARSATTGSRYHVRRDAYLVSELRVRRRIPGKLANSGYARETSSAVYPFFGVALAVWVLMNG